MNPDERAAVTQATLIELLDEIAGLLGEVRSRYEDDLRKADDA